MFVHTYIRVLVRIRSNTYCIFPCFQRVYVNSLQYYCIAVVLSCTSDGYLCHNIHTRARAQENVVVCSEWIVVGSLFLLTWVRFSLRQKNIIRFSFSLPPGPTSGSVYLSELVSTISKHLMGHSKPGSSKIVACSARSYQRNYHVCQLIKAFDFNLLD